jgi:hypothetical protein
MSRNHTRHAVLLAASALALAVLVLPVKAFAQRTTETVDRPAAVR